MAEYSVPRRSKEEDQTRIVDLERGLKKTVLTFHYTTKKRFILIFR